MEFKILPVFSKRQFSRREFLKSVGALTASSLLLTEPAVQAALNLALSTTTNAMWMKEEIPQPFEGVKIPKRNEFWRFPENIMYDALSRYTAWAKEGNLPPIHFKKGDEYLVLARLAKKIPRLFGDDMSNLSWDEQLSYKLVEDPFENIDQSEGLLPMGVGGIAHIMLFNPGSKIIIKAEKYLCEKYGLTRGEMLMDIGFNDLSKRIKRKIQPEDLKIATKIVTDQLKDATKYFEELRKESSDPLSISTAIAYFLYMNNGDLRASMWDATTLFHVLARGDLDTLGHAGSKSLENAKRLAYLFKDEFSPHISLNWLAGYFASKDDEIPQWLPQLPTENRYYYLKFPITKNSPLAGDSTVRDNDGNLLFAKYANFMPVPKAGVFYHNMTIMTWAAVSAEPWVVKSMILGYYRAKSLGLSEIDFRDEQGTEKVMADCFTAQSAERIKKTVNIFTNEV